MGRSMQEVLIFDAFMRHTSDSIVIKEYFATERGGFTGGKISCASAAKAGHYGLTMDSIRGRTDFDLMPHYQAAKAFQDDIWVMETAGRSRTSGDNNPQERRGGQDLGDQIPLDPAGRRDHRGHVHRPQHHHPGAGQTAGRDLLQFLSRRC